MKPTTFIGLLADMAKGGLLEVIERQQAGGFRSAKVYAVTDAGRTLVQDSAKF
jgi:DNA-binding PadR family transcriptional regulator